MMIKSRSLHFIARAHAASGRLLIRCGRPALAALTFSVCSTANAQEVAAAREADNKAVTGSLEEVIVTAERAGRSLMDTSTSVIVLDEAALEQRPLIEGTNDLLSRIPNVTATGGTNLAPAVRGVDGTGAAQGGNASLAGTRSRLNMQIDGRPTTFNEFVFGDAGLWDVQQVEVLRGPQSTLQGRNAIAGTVVVKTKDPTYEPEGKLRVIGGDLQTRQYSGAFSAPIVADQLAFRVAADHRSSRSFADYDAFPGVGGFPGVEDPGEYESTTYRGKLLIEPRAVENFSALITVSYAKTRSPQNEDVPEPVAEDDHVAAFPQMPIIIPRTVSGTAELRWQASDALTWETRAGWADFESLRLAGLFGNATREGRQLFAEQLARFTRGALSGLGGLYYYDEQRDDVNHFGPGGAFDDSTRTGAVFGESTYRLAERFDVTLGGRYEEEHRRREGRFGPFVVDLDDTYQVFLPKLVLAWHPADHLTIGTLVGRGYNGGGAGVVFEPPFTTYSFDPEFVWNYEVFTRASLAGGKLALTGNVFYSDYEDMQLPFITPGFSSESAVIVNAEKVVTYGAEISAAWQALPSLQLTGGLGLLETDIKNFAGSSFEGNELTQAPPLSADVAAHFRRGGLELSLQGRYSDSYFSDIDNLSAQRTDAYWLANAQAVYQFTHLRVFAAVSNLLDADDRVYRYPPFELLGTLVPTSATILRPRTYSIGVQVEF